MWHTIAIWSGSTRRQQWKAVTNSQLLPGKEKRYTLTPGTPTISGLLQTIIERNMECSWAIWDQTEWTVIGMVVLIATPWLNAARVDQNTASSYHLEVAELHCAPKAPTNLKIPSKTSCCLGFHFHSAHSLAQRVRKMSVLAQEWNRCTVSNDWNYLVVIKVDDRATRKGPLMWTVIYWDFGWCMMVCGYLREKKN